MSDPGPEFWARQAEQLTVINAMRGAIEAAPERFTGLEARGSGDVTVHVVDLAAAREPAFVALLDDARTVGIRVAIAEAARSLAELAAVHHVVMRQSSSFASLGTGSWIDAATATVRVQVAEAMAHEALAAFTGHGDALVVEVVPVEEGMTAFWSPAEPPPASWPVPPVPAAEAAGWDAEELTARYRAAGFEAEVCPYGYIGGLNSDLRLDRIRLLVRDGIVVDARQG